MYQYNEPPKKSLRWFLAVAAAFLTLVASTHLASAGESSEGSKYEDKSEVTSTDDDHKSKDDKSDSKDKDDERVSDHGAKGDSDDKDKKDDKDKDDEPRVSDYGKGGDSNDDKQRDDSRSKDDDDDDDDKKRVVRVAECPDDVKQKVTDYSVTAADRTEDDLGGYNANVDSGEEVTVTFTVEEGCEGPYTLASYEAESTSTSKEALARQKLFAYETRELDAGKQTLTVNVPDCYFQIDFAHGAVIEDFGDDDNDFYGGRLIDSAIGGEECKKVEAKEVVEREEKREQRETTTTTEAPAEVEDEVVTRPQVEDEEEVRDDDDEEVAELAETGINPFPLTALATLLFSAGAGMLRKSKTMRDEIW